MEAGSARGTLEGAVAIDAEALIPSARSSNTCRCHKPRPNLQAVFADSELTVEARAKIPSCLIPAALALILQTTSFFPTGWDLRGDVCGAAFPTHAYCGLYFRSRLPHTTTSQGLHMQDRRWILPCEDLVSTYQAGSSTTVSNEGGGAARSDGAIKSAYEE